MLLASGAAAKDLDAVRSSRRRRILCLISGMTLIAVGLGVNVVIRPLGVRPDPFWVAYPPRAAALLLGMYFLVRYWRLSVEVTNDSHRRAEPQPPTTDLVAASIEFATEVEQSRFHWIIDGEAAFEFVQRFLSPAVARARIAENVRLRSDRVIRSSTVEFLPELYSDHCSLIDPVAVERESVKRLVPVVRFNKGQLISNLEIRDATGQLLPTLPHEEYMVLTGRCIFTLLAAAVRQSQDHQQRIRYAEVQTLLMARAISSDVLDQKEAEAESERLTSFIAARLEVASEADLELLCQFVTRAQVAYAIVVETEISRDRHAVFQISYEERLSSTPAQNPETSSRRERLSARVREWSGLDPNSLFIDVSRTKKCASYHLEIEAPDGYYIGETWFHDHTSMTPIPVLEPRNIYQSSRPYFRCPNPSGQSYAHLYTRSFQHSAARSPFLYVRFFEKLPGSLGKAWILSTAVLAIVWIFGATWRAPSPGGGEASALGGIDPGSLIFALPLALWAIMGFGERSRGYFSTVASLVSIISSLFISFLALVLTLFINSGRISGGLNWPSAALVSHPYWIVLLGIATVNFLWIGEKFIIRFWRWRRVIAPANATFNSTPGSH